MPQYPQDNFQEYQDDQQPKQPRMRVRRPMRRPKNNQFQEPYQQPGAKKPFKYNPKTLWKNFIHHTLGLELSKTGKIALSVASIFLIASFIFGIFTPIGQKQDEQKKHDMGQIAQALDSFYYNSSSIKGKRSYPLSVCSSSPNEIDFESTLRQILTGKNTQINSHQYISPEKYPKDLQGDYTSSLEKRENPSECAKAVSEVAYKGIGDVCDFNKESSPECYLYTSSATGDKYQIGYYSQEVKSLVIFEKNRDKPLIQVIYQNNG